MQGEGISTPYIHRTRWDPFSSKCLCVKLLILSYDREIKETGFIYYYFEFGTVSKPCAYVFPCAMGKSKLRSSSQKGFKFVVLIL